MTRQQSKGSMLRSILPKAPRDERRLDSRRNLRLQILDQRQLLAGDGMPMDNTPAMVSMMDMTSSHSHNNTMVSSSTGGMNHTAMNHGGHAAVMDLVALDQADYVASANGAWSNPATWSNNQVPGEGARVVIPQGVQVTINSELTPEFKTVRVDGVLNFATDRDTQLLVDTLVSTPTGELVIGTETNPVGEDYTAQIVFADDGAIDRKWDPSLLSRGALLHGKTTIHGAAKTSYGTLASTSSGSPQAVQGATQITLASAPDGWKVDDWITIAGVDPNDPEGDEVVQITAIDGATITFAGQGLQQDHVSPRDDLQVHVANLSRNVQFTSENTDAEHRGHIMFMHTNDVDVRYASFQGLGRTDKSIDLEDWRLVSGSEGSVGEDLTEVEDLGGFNVRGRYSVHFHRGGFGGEPGLVQGAVVRDDPGWAYVNHSSNVDFLDNVSHNITGAAYNTEAGDEEGSFIRNIAIRTVNPNGNPNPPDVEVNEDQSPDIRVLTQDFGWQGDGFWFHGPGVTVEDNVVSGATGHGYIYWTLGLVERGLGENLVDAGRVPNGDRIGPAGETPIRPKQVPVPSFDGNVAYNVPKGLNIAYLHTDNRDDNDEHFVLEGLLPEVPQEYENLLQSTFRNFTAWNVPLSGVAAPYSGRLTFENIELIGTGAEGSIGLKLDQFANDNDLTVRNIKIDGYLTGIAAPRQGNGVIENAEISAITGIRINVPDNGPRDLQLRDLRFLPLSDLFDPEDADGQISIDMNAAFDIGLAGGLFGIEEAFFDEPNLLNVPGMFQKDRITLSNPGEGTVGLYFDVQDPGFIPVPVDGELSQYVREELVGLTNQQLQDDFGFSFSDAVTPETAMEHPLVQGGLAGPALQPFAAFPPARDTYWVDYLASLGVDSPGFGSGGPGMGDPGDGDPGDDSMDDSPVDDDDLEDEMPVDDDDSMDDHFAEDDGFDEDPGDDSMDDSPVDDDDLEDEMPVDDDEPMDDDFDGEDDFDGDPSDNDSMDESPVDDDDLEDEMPGDDDESMDEHFDEDDEVDEDFHNDMMPEDVNADSVITARDALMIINRIVREALGVESGSQSAFPDVNNDGRVTALDALLVINAIGRLIDLDADVEPASHDEGMEALDTVFRDEDNEFVEPIEDALF